MFGHGETVIRQRGVVVNDSRTGEKTGVDWENPDELEIAGVAFDPGASTEPIEAGRSSLDFAPTIYDPSYADVVADDRLVVRGKTYDVDGDPAAYRNPFTGWEPGQVIRLKLREG